MLKARIIGTGEFLPEKVLTNKDLEKFVDTTDEWIRQRSGIAQRHVAEKGQGFSDLGARAGAQALEDAGVDPKDVDVIICCTLSPDYLFPATACMIQAHLGADNAAAFDVNAACSGFLYGLATANSFIQTGLYKTVLLVGGELISNRIVWKNRDTGVLFGDGAGALLLQASEGDHGVLSMYLGADGKNGDMLILPKGGSKEPVTPENADDETYTIYMKGSELFKRAVVVFGEASKKAFEATGLGPKDIKLFIPHQANARIIEAAAERVGFTQEQVYINIDRVANTVHGTLPIALHQAKQEGRVEEGDNLLFATFGAGVTWGSSIVRL